MKHHSTKEALEAEALKGEEAMHETMQETSEITLKESHNGETDRSGHEADRSREENVPMHAAQPTSVAPPSPPSNHEPPSTATDLLSPTNHKNKNKKGKKKKKSNNHSSDQISEGLNEVSTPSLKLKKKIKFEYVRDNIKLVLGSHDLVQSEKEIDTLLERLNTLLDKENRNSFLSYKLIQHNNEEKEDKLNEKEPKMIGYQCDDLGYFSLGININNHYISNAFVDTGSSVNYMSKDIYDILDLPKLKPISLKTKNQKLVGIIDNLIVSIGDFVYPTKFLIFNIPRDHHKDVVLGRSFLHSSDAELSVRKGTIKLYACGDHMRKTHMIWNINHRLYVEPTNLDNGTCLDDLEVLDRFVECEKK